MIQDACGDSWRGSGWWWPHPTLTGNESSFGDWCSRIVLARRLSRPFPNDNVRAFERNRKLRQGILRNRNDWFFKQQTLYRVWLTYSTALTFCREVYVRVHLERCVLDMHRQWRLMISWQSASSERLHDGGLVISAQSPVHYGHFIVLLLQCWKCANVDIQFFV